jgi:hypothetical protein
MHVSRKAALSLAALSLAAALGVSQPAAAQVLTTGNPIQAAPDVQPQPSTFALSQIAALQAEKASRTPAQTKIDSNLLRAALLARAASTPARMGGITAAAPAEAGALSAATLSLLNTVPVSDEAQPDVNGMVAVDIKATVTADLLARISAAGGVVNGSWPAYNAVRATLPLLQLETVAASPNVRSIRPAEQAHVVRNRVTPPAANVGHPGPLVPGLPIFAPIPTALPAATTPAARRVRVKAALPALLDRARRAQAAGRPGFQSTEDFPLFSLAADVAAPASPADPEGDLAQRADLARTTFGVDGTGIKIGIISDSVDGLAAEQQAGRLGPVTVLPGQDGTPGTGEGTAMLEIVHRLAPGAQLYFATANPTEANFASNILALQQAGCNVIVDDVAYFDEPPFQDGVIAQAVDTVSAAGAFYFSSAGNNYNLDQKGITATWEGDWRASGNTLTDGSAVLPTLAYDAANHYRNPVLTATSAPKQAVFLFWADPQGGATDDYDVYVFNSAFSSILFASTGTQDGTQDPIEACEADQGDLVVVTKYSGNGVLLHLAVTSNGAAALNYSTPFGIVGHAGAATCYAVAASNASVPYKAGRSFQSTDVTETFSSDGPRRVLFTASGAEIMPGNRSSSGGVLRQKPVLAGSDGVTTYFNPFYGTSAAAPHDAAIAGLVLSANPYLVSAQMFGLLTSSCIPIDTAFGAVPNRDAGYGILDAHAAVGNAVAAATPTASAQNVTTGQDTPTAVTLTGSDPNKQALTYAVVTAPTHGTLSGSGPNLTYTPSAGYTGPDSFTFTVSNGVYTSAPATVSLTVNPIVLSFLTFLSPVPAGTVLTATVTLNGITASGVVVGLASSDSSVVRVHRAVVIPAGSRSATFAIKTYPSQTTKTVTIQATLNQVTLTKDLTITGS